MAIIKSSQKKEKKPRKRKARKVLDKPKMPKITLSPYIIKIRQKNSQDFEDLENLFGTNKKLFDIIKDIKTDYQKKPFKEEKSKKAIKFENRQIEFFINKELKITQDVVYYGEFGVLRKVMDTETGEINQQAIKSTESPVYDLTFTYAQDTLIKNIGLIIVQSYSRMSYKTVLYEVIRKKLAGEFDIEFMLEINPLIDNELAEIVENGGRIVEINLTSHDIPDSADILADSKEKETKIEIKNKKTITFSLASSAGLSLAPIQKLTDLMKNLKPILYSDTTVFYEATKCPVDEVKIAVSTDDRNYTFYLDQEESGDIEFKKVIPLTDVGLISNDGIIKNDSILVIAREHIETIANKYRMGKYPIPGIPDAL